MKVDVASEVLLGREQARRFEHERIERGGRIEHSWCLVLWGRRLMLSLQK
jgi:hypothetical protein